MYCLSTSRDFAAVSCNLKLIIFRLNNTEHKLLEIPAETNLQEKPGPASSKQSNSKDTSDDTSSTSIVCLAFSSCGTWLATCSTSKHLIVWKTSDWSVVSDRTMPRAASSAVFTPCGRHIVVADKSGDAFVFSATNWSEEGSLLLGHLSMLLDVLMSDDGKYVLTCDRDEKIRVSHFPNAYNIAAYCLGHEEFVTSMALLPHDTSILVSCSGDGSLRLWNFLNGSLCKTYSCSSDASANLLKIQDGESSQADIPLKSLCCSKLDASTSVACVIPDSYNGCLIYSISSADRNFNNINVNISLLQAITFKVEPCAIKFSNNGVLLVLAVGGSQALHSYIFDEEDSIFSMERCSAELQQSVSTVNGFENFFVESSVAANNISQLYKRKFDNLQVYHERKKARLINNTSSAAL